MGTDSSMVKAWGGSVQDGGGQGGKRGAFAIFATIKVNFKKREGRPLRQQKANFRGVAM